MFILIIFEKGSKMSNYDSNIYCSKIPTFNITIDELIADIKTLSREGIRRKYAGHSVRVLKRAKNWRELVALEFDGSNLEKLANKYNLEQRTLLKFLQKTTLLGNGGFIGIPKQNANKGKIWAF